jgi:hypothetical protein
MALKIQEDKTLTSGTNQLLLTNIKIRFISKSWGEKNVKSIMLNHISSAEIKSTNPYGYLIIGFAGLIASSYFYSQTHIILGLIFLIIMAFIYWSQKEIILNIQSSSNSISYSPKKLSTNEAIEFLNDLENRID